MCTSYQIIAQYHKTDFYISTSAKRGINNQGTVHEKNKNGFSHYNFKSNISRFIAF